VWAPLTIGTEGPGGEVRVGRLPKYSDELKKDAVRSVRSTEVDDRLGGGRARGEPAGMDMASGLSDGVDAVFRGEL
jgi:hypothetical protein